MAEAQGARFAAANGCDDADGALACLRAIEPTTLIQSATYPDPGGLFYQSSQPDNAFAQAIVDGVVVTDQPATLLEAGQAADVPIIQGATTAEGALFHVGIFGDTAPMDAAQYEAALGRRFGDRADDVLAQYPVADFDTPNDALSAVTGDAFFACPAHRTAGFLADNGADTYLYRFHGVLDPALLPGLEGKAFHSADIPYVFGNDFVLGTVAESAKPLSDAIRGYWLRFVETGDPNGGSAPAWPKYATAEDSFVSFDDPVAVDTGYNDKCAFWEGISLEGQ
jgi:para-nitrobenzyl esterase